MIDIARGVLEFQESLRSQYDARCTLLHTREAVPAITHIERKLDDFFSTRISCRLMISHILALNETDDKCTSDKEVSPQGSGGGRDVNGMHMLNEKPRMVGALTTNTMPVLVLQQAYEAAKYMCRRDYHGLAPDLVVNGMSLEEYLTVAPPQRSFAYVAQHLFYIFLEILKNAMRATVEKSLFDSGGDYERCREAGLPPVTVTLPDLSSMWDFERTIKIADKGYGMKREILKRASSYFYSSANQKPDGTQELPDFDSRAPLAGFGFGLPISKVMARYFNGDLEINSIPGAGKFPEHNPKFETNVTFHENTLDFDARFLGHLGAAKSVPYSRGAGNAIAVDVNNADLHKAFKDMQAFMSPSVVLKDLHYDSNKNEVWKDVPFFGRLAMHYVRA
ncbi:hypothetical protein FOZ63_032393 [Perkinsus olseni]|uniref:Protein-serine/threonine kinase n=1 Tax=Perkinsus olseni TaxID=32597 RepID=A0A7J6S788_PEROL|nr:hypothetical protein FOZ63_032393 [Perkinsus olseni]